MPHQWSIALIATGALLFPIVVAVGAVTITERRRARALKRRKDKIEL